jgi:hypothetical protein
MAITAGEAGQIEKANATGKTPVVFIHGLWLLPSSWRRWLELFEQAGYAPLAPGWPDDPETVEAARANPDVFAGKGVAQVADHFAAVIGGLERKPAMSKAAFKRQSKNPGVTEHIEMPNRDHSLVIDHGWREVAEKALAFIERFGD